MAAKINRHYGIERSLGDILYNPATRSVFTRVDLGVFSLNLTLVQREDKKTYDVLKSYKDKNGQDQVVKLGQSFLVTRKDGSIVDGLSKFSLGLLREWDKEVQKDITRSNDALFLTTHKLKDKKVLNEETGLTKVGWLTGQFGIEVAKEDAKDGENGSYQAPEPEIIGEDDEIPF
jgi:hypothetical protein